MAMTVGGMSHVRRIHLLLAPHHRFVTAYHPADDAVVWRAHDL